MGKRLVFAGAIALIVSFGTSLHGCSKSSGGSGAASTAAGATGTSGVIATSPVDGDSNVPVDETLYVTFDADIDPASLLPGAIELQDDTGVVSVNVSAVTPRVVSIDPVLNLRSITRHLLRVTTQVTDTAGAQLAGETLVQFTTSAVVPITGSGFGPPPPATPGPFQAGVAVTDMTPPVGVPLSGFGGGDRRQILPDLNPFNYHTFLTPSQGIKDPVLAKALVLANGTERVCIVTLDAIATDARLVDMAYQKASALGFTIPKEKVLVCSSHTHSGPGAMTKSLVWEIIAADLYVDRVAQHVADKIAEAMLGAEQGMVAARVGVGSAQVVGATNNRRHNDSPALGPDDVDTEMVVVRVDRANGTPLATVWNFGVHGTHFGTSNLDYSADIMGGASNKAETQGAGVCLFMNGAEGDVRPSGAYDATSQLIADGILAARSAATPTASGVLQSTHEMVDMGAPYIALGFRHLGSNIQSSSFIAGLQTLGINPTISFTFPNGWMEREFRYQAIRVNQSVITSMPGEPIHEIGLLLKQDGHGMGFTHVMPAGLANGHGSYFTTAAEYGYGGYEGMASMFGPQNGDMLMDACRRLMDLVRP